MFKHILKGLMVLAGIGSVFAQEKPNIIFIMADDLGYGDLGCYGQKKIQTPQLDKMASEGMLFTDFYAGNTVCAPSRYSLLTGKHPGHSYVRGNFEIGHSRSFLGQLPIPENEPTIFDLLKNEGYSTAAFGKWGVGRAESSGAPDKKGVDDFFGFNCQRHAHTYYPRYLEGNRGEKIWLDGNERKDGGKQYAHDLFTEKAIDFIKQNKNKPFFLYLPYTIPHTPFMVPDLGIYENKNWEENHKKQAAMISSLDKDVGRILDLLKELKIEKNTIVFFTSDNGAHGDGGTLEFFEASGPLRGKKRDLYEGGIRTPMIVRWPERIEAGSISDHIGVFWDIMPTFADLTGTIPPRETDGISFLPELLNESQPKHEFLYWEFFGTNYQWTPESISPRNWLKSQAVRIDNWKGVKNDMTNNLNTPLELYDLSSDIGEKQNIAEQYPDIVHDILKIMRNERNDTEFFKFK